MEIPDATTDLVGTPDVPETVVELEQLDGFSTTGGIIVQFDGPIDVEGIAPDELADELDFEPMPVADARTYLEAGAPFHLIDVERGELVGVVPRYWEQEQDDYFITSEFTLIAAPAVPLRPRGRYLFVVTNKLRAADGGRVHRPAEMDRIVGADDPYAAQVNEGLAALEAAIGVPPADVVVATAFTAASIPDRMLALAETIRAGAAPALLEPWAAVEGPTAGDPRVRFRAVYEANEYRKPAPDSRFELDTDGTVVAQGTTGLEVFMAASDDSSSEPRTVVIYGHGLGGDKGGLWGTSERLAELNCAVFAIDSPHHGSRATGDNDLDTIFQFFGIDSDEMNFVIGRARDNFRQMAADQLELVKLIKSLDTLDVLPSGAPDGVPDLDTSRILYIGHSFGAVQGPLIFALAPEITQAVWNVGGAGLMMLLRDSNTFGIVVGGLAPEGIPDGAVARFMAITQAIVDPGDPLNYARFASQEEPAGVPGWVPREVLLQEVLGDTIVPNTTSRALARAAGLVLIDALQPVTGLDAVSGPVTANLPSGVTGALSQFDTINGNKIAVHGDLIFAPEGRAQYLEFFKTALENANGTIPSPY